MSTSCSGRSSLARPIFDEDVHRRHAGERSAVLGASKLSRAQSSTRPTSERACAHFGLLCAHGFTPPMQGCWLHETPCIRRRDAECRVGIRVASLVADLEHGVRANGQSTIKEEGQSHVDEELEKSWVYGWRRCAQPRRVARFGCDLPLAAGVRDAFPDGGHYWLEYYQRPNRLQRFGRSKCHRRSNGIGRVGYNDSCRHHRCELVRAAVRKQRLGHCRDSHLLVHERRSVLRVQHDYSIERRDTHHRCAQ